MIREARQEDVARLVEMGRLFHSLAGFREPYSDEKVHVVLSGMIGSDFGILLVLESDGAVRGMAGALLYPCWFSDNVVTGQELMWWVDPDYRGDEAIRLFDALTKSAKEKGAQTFSMIALSDERQGAMARLYRKHGFTEQETVFSGVL